jgi:septum formation protein
MLRDLSGKSHTVVTGVTIRNPKKILSFSSSTIVFFREICNEEINYYIDNFAPFDKAGAYGVQEWIGYTAIRRIEGSYYNVVGLPVQKLGDSLKEFILSFS